MARFFRRGLLVLLLIRYGGSYLFYQSLSLPVDEIDVDNPSSETTIFAIIAISGFIMGFFLIGALFIGFISWFFGLTINNQLKNKDREMDKAMAIKERFDSSI